jgi:hypothetical protein
VAKDDKKKITAEDMFGRLLEQQGLSPMGAVDNDGPVMTELDVAMNALKVAHAVLNALINKRILSIDEAMEYLIVSHEVIDSYMEIIDEQMDD